MALGKYEKPVEIEMQDLSGTAGEATAGAETIEPVTASVQAGTTADGNSGGESTNTPSEPPETSVASSSPEAEKSKTNAEKAEAAADKSRDTSAEKALKTSSGTSRGELLKLYLVNKYKGIKDEEKDGEKEKKKKKTKLEKARSVGEKLTAAAGMYDNKLDVGTNIKNIGEKVFDSGEKSEKPKTQEEKKDTEEVKKDPDKAAADAVKELDSEGRKEEPGKKSGESDGNAANTPKDKPGELAKTEEEPKEEKKDEKKQDEKPLPMKELLTEGAGAYNNTVGAVSSLYAAKNDKTRRGKARSRVRGAQFIMNAVGNLTGGAGTLLSSGKVGSGGGIDIAGGVLSAVTGGLGAISSIVGLIAGKRESKRAKKTAENIEAFTEKGGKYSQLRNSSRLVGAVKRHKGDWSEEKYNKMLGAARKRRSTEKANKLSMAIAAKFNRQKSKTSGKGIGDILTGTAQLLSGILSATGASGNSFVSSFLGPVLSKGSELAKKKLDERDKKNAEEEKKNDDSLRTETIKDYLSGKREKIKIQAKKLISYPGLSDEERDTLSGGLTDAEADKIALARLGVQITDMSADTPVSDADLQSGFDKVIMRRANNIMNAENKSEMLDALMLPGDASVEDVAAALKGE